MLAPLDHNQVATSFPQLTDLSYLESGGMKHAYSAVGPLGAVALKVVDEPVLDASDEAEVDSATLPLPHRVKREVGLMASIDHPNIVKLLDGPTISRIAGERRVWWLEPYYPDNLKARLTRPLEVDSLSDLGVGLLSGVERLATDGIVHRDIKPGNIMYSSDDVPVLIDLGIALLAEGTGITDTGATPPRTEGFMAPEQLLPRSLSPIDARCDLFLVGITLYFAASLVMPFDPRHPDYARQLVNGSLNLGPLKQVGLPACMIAVIGRLLEAHQAGRYRTPYLALRAWEDCE